MAVLFNDDVLRLREATSQIYSAMHSLECLKEDLESWDEQADIPLNEDTVEELADIYEELLDLTTRIEELM